MLNKFLFYVRLYWYMANTVENNNYKSLRKR